MTKNYQTVQHEVRYHIEDISLVLAGTDIIVKTRFCQADKSGFLHGRSEVTRTPGILLPKQARYQLRYTPIA